MEYFVAIIMQIFHCSSLLTIHTVMYGMCVPTTSASVLVLKNMYRELKGDVYFNLEFQQSSYIIKLAILY